MFGNPSGQRYHESSMTATAPQNKPPGHEPDAALREERQRNKEATRRSFEELLDLPLSIWQGLLNKILYLPDTNYRLACRLSEAGRFRDAIFRLRITLWLAPEHQPSWYLLGHCYYARGEHAKAVEAFKKSLQLNPDHEDTLFLMASLNPMLVAESKLPRTMPAHLAREHFDRIAPGYDLEQAKRGYKGHMLMNDGLRKWLDTQRTNFVMLDLGCGTGLCGLALNDIVRQMTGVDISRRMLDITRERRSVDGQAVYDQTFHRDLRDFLAEITEPSFEVILAAHVFPYIGDLHDIFGGAYRALAIGGLFAFQIEPYAHEAGYGMIRGQGRFGHSYGYIRTLCERAGFVMLEHRSVDLFPGLVYDQYVLIKPEAATPASSASA